MAIPLTEQIVAAMRAAFPTTPAPMIAPYYAQIEYHLGWRNQDLSLATGDGGKLVRPMLAVLACQALGGTVEQALPLAAGLQLLHDFSLIHDDIEDHSTTRRGRATLWTLWGMEAGINAGDGLFAIAHRSVYRLLDVGVDAATTLAVVRGFEEAILRIVEGQYLDMAGEGDFNVTTERYLATIQGKTAALLAAATGLGARIATADAATVTALTTFGEALGMAFQIQDDVLDIWGDPELTGKPRAADLLQRKLSLPVIHALEHATPADREQFVAIYSQPVTPTTIAPLLAILERTEAQTAALALSDRYHHTAQAALATITPQHEAAWQQLHQLTQRLLRRDH